PLIKLSIIFLMLTFSLKAYEKYEDFLNDFKSLSVEAGQVYEINNCIIKKDVGKLTLESGKFYLCKPIDGRTCAAIFVGKGNFDFVPTNKVERGQLHRYFDTTEIHREIKSAFLLFGDSSLHNMLKDFKKTDEETPDKVKDIIKNSIYFVTNKEKTIIENYISDIFLDKEFNDMFYSYITLTEGKEVFFYIDPNDVEEVNFLRTDFVVGMGKFLEYVCCFPTLNHNPTNDSIKEFNKIDIEKYTITYNLNNDHELKCIAQLDYKILKENIKWVKFNISDKLIIDSIVAKNGSHLSFYRTKKSTLLWLKIQDGIKVHDTSYITFFYHGNDNDYLNGWYPKHTYRNKSYFDVTYYFPKKYNLLSAGELTSSSESFDIKTSHWITNCKIYNESFTFDLYNKANIEEKDCMPIELLYINPYMKDHIKEDIVP
ncbi:MAG: hypothetical protein ABSG15_03275, partial [FCB group bacterium]